MKIPKIKAELQNLRDEEPREFAQKAIRHFFPVKHLKIRTRYLSEKYDNYAEIYPNDIIYIDPQNVVGVTSRRFFNGTFDPEVHRGSVSSGKWDKNPTSLSNRSEYSTVENHQEKFPDADTIKEQLEVQYKSPTSWVDLCDLLGIDTSIKEHQLAVNIDRNGKFQINSGLHQFAIAQIAGIDRIPCQVAVRHTKWQRFRDQVEYYIKHHGKGYTYNELPHPDMKQWNSEANHKTSERFEIVRKGIDVNEGKVLDIGSHMDGYFCTQLERSGFTCYAVERSRQRSYFLRKFRSFNNCEFRVISDDITQSTVLEEKFDVCLALNVFHHMMKSEAKYQGFIRLLERLNADTLIVQIITDDFIQSWEERGNTWYKKFVEDDFVEHIIDNSDFSEYECLGRIEEDGRPFYKLV